MHIPHDNAPLFDTTSSQKSLPFRPPHQPGNLEKSAASYDLLFHTEAFEQSEIRQSSGNHMLVHDSV